MLNIKFMRNVQSQGGNDTQIRQPCTVIGKNIYMAINTFFSFMTEPKEKKKLKTAKGKIINKDYLRYNQGEQQEQSQGSCKAQKVV